MNLFKNKKLKKEPKVSIILPNYNSSKTIIATINSVLKQTYKNWELIIVDDCSDKKTKDILAKYKRIKNIKIFYSEKNKGAGQCRNVAIKKSNSYYLAFIDSDDLWKNNKLKMQINFMQNNNYDFTYTYYETFSGNNQVVKSIKTPEKFNFKSFTRNTSIATSTMIVKKKLFGKIKLRNEEVLKVYPEIKKIKKILNWVPKVDFNVGLNSTIRDYKNFFLKSPRLF